ncbi:MAG: sulfatase-like hydrolase/transferase [Phycisphaera sp.]|nr:sulfatase-like hydrolase/transferase [Phycisphaera sp.]
MPMKPNIVFVLTDQWRAQATGYAGDPNVKTPNLDALALRAINFTNAVSVCPVCTPARAALMTGRYPTTTGMFYNDLYLPAEELCYAEVFKQAGYDTAYIGKWHLDGHGRDSYIPPERRQGFDYWKVLECTHDYNHSHYYAHNDPTKRTWEGYDAYAQTKDAQSYIQDHAGGDKPFLLFIGFGGPHFPHHTAPQELQALYPPDKLTLRPNVPPEEQEHTRKELQGYYAHCTAIDRCVGDLYKTIEEAGVADDTIFIFTSDHGDMHGSHGKSSHRKQVPWDESACVPFLCLYPKIHEGPRKVTTPINILDILPSLLALCEIPIPDTVEGEDLSPQFKGVDTDKDRAALIMSVVPFDRRGDFKAYRGLRMSRYTYVRDTDGPWLLYDNLNDPYQMHNLVHDPGHAALRDSMDRELQSRLDRNGDDLPTGEQAMERWGLVSLKGEYRTIRTGKKTQSSTSPRRI